MKKFLLVIFILFTGFQFFSQIKSDNNEFMSGDIIFQTSESNQSKAIQIATKSRYSHMGIIYLQDNEYYVFEAVQPVKLTLLTDWIKRGENEHYVVKRLKNSKEVLTSEKLSDMKVIGNRFLGKNYDLYFEWSDERIYCSELVWKIYKEALGIEVGELETLQDFDLTNEAVTEKLRERYGNNIPKNELVISPASMFKSEKLQTIYQN
ncbi:MAG: YiiX family permuted papain-like enzyme [Flavobacteriales bacterium]|jgi:hypothetical protein|tara:strand:+ start:120 stop:740 length:621 start_codon:yes stop_codon:yes gene_type:complete